ncbi:SDR family NAD(P)-dependent oxidoreductase [Pontibacter sp. G13]|uniref:SDR family NAD(P)-dependent oxidoreductase n=1 Tax=Pontibacter sp. G13 TaxID=3074898 RepID=UPI00288AB10B|nr:SDR family NAD(P)-dependent oxidoreductase [Pontibacter sp. G13]WNJ19356.1 SDR family NAD(P)-dependent oxidoreductase [Pontibacter sp. G13]
MKKTILITGSTDGIGLVAAQMLASKGHQILLHGRSSAKLEKVKRSIGQIAEAPEPEGYIADLSQMADVEHLAQEVSANHNHLDVLINNAGVYRSSHAITSDGLDIRFVVNTIAPYLLTQRLLPILDGNSRVVNLSSAAQAPVNIASLFGQAPISEGAAYAQSKLALTMWTRHLAEQLGTSGPMVVSVNPGSLLGTNMVKEAYGMQGKDVRIGGNILVTAAIGPEFAQASGQYFDNDIGQFSPPHPDGLNDAKCAEVTEAIELILKKIAPASQR